MRHLQTQRGKYPLILCLLHLLTLSLLVFETARFDERGKVDMRGMPTLPGAISG